MTSYPVSSFQSPETPSRPPGSPPRFIRLGWFLKASARTGVQMCLHPVVQSQQPQMKLRLGLLTSLLPSFPTSLLHYLANLLPPCLPS